MKLTSEFCVFAFVLFAGLTAVLVSKVDVAERLGAYALTVCRVNFHEMPKHAKSPQNVLER